MRARLAVASTWGLTLYMAGVARVSLRGGSFKRWDALQEERVVEDEADKRTEVKTVEKESKTEREKGWREEKKGCGTDG